MYTSFDSSSFIQGIFYKCLKNVGNFPNSYGSSITSGQFFTFIALTNTAPLALLLSSQPMMARDSYTRGTLDAFGILGLGEVALALGRIGGSKSAAICGS